jgi:hypothetical protein
MVAFDSTILSLLLFPDAAVHQGPDGKTVEYARERVQGLIQSLEDAKKAGLIHASTTKSA